MELIVSLIAGAIGGNAAGGVLKPVNLGMFGNSLAGIAGGFAAGQLILQAQFASGLFQQTTTGAAGVMAVLVASACGGSCATLLGGLLRQVTARR